MASRTAVLSKPKIYLRLASVHQMLPVQDSSCRTTSCCLAPFSGSNLREWHLFVVVSEIRSLRALEGGRKLLLCIESGLEAIDNLGLVFWTSEDTHRTSTDRNNGLV